MRVVWIIGNGFDLRMGLDTGYKDFLKRVYLEDEAESRRREKLENVICERIDSKESDRWSDLEALLAESSKGYSVADEEFNLTFEGIQRLFIDYVMSEENRLADEFDTDVIEDFWDSITHFHRRLVNRDRNLLITNNRGNAAIEYAFISLNYTTVFDRFLEEAKTAHDPFDTYVYGNYKHSDSARSVFHPHGVIDDGVPNGIVFGIANSAQFENPSFVEDESICEMWVKAQKNESLYGDDNTDQLAQMIGSADMICIYGCSLGKSDEYIWEMIGKRYRSTSKTNIVLFVHNFPDRRGLDGRRYQQMRDEKTAELKTAMKLEDVDDVKLRGRVVLVPTHDVFQKKPSLSENDKYRKPAIDET